MASIDEIMTSIGSRCGGVWVRSGDGDLLQLTAGDFLLEAEPFARGGSIGYQCSIGHLTFGEVVNAIAGDPAETFVCLKWFQVIRSSGADEEAFAELLQEAREAVRGLRLKDLIGTFLEPPHGKPTSPQLCHLAALAWRGDFVEILEYRRRMAGGGHNPFVPAISGPVIDRALDEALTRSGQEG